MKKIHIASIAEYDEDGELYSSIMNAETEDQLLSLINQYLKKESEDGHTIPGTPFANLTEANGFDGFDRDGCNHYKITTATVIIN